MLDNLYAFGVWLNRTELHFWARGILQTIPWVSPTVQTIHIVSVCAVIGAIGMIDLRLLGAAARSQSPAEMAKRLLPWLWTALVLLLVTGSALILNRPPRYFDNIAFLAKMAMLLIAVVLTLLLARGLRHGDGYWTASPARRSASRTMAAVSVLMWTGVVIAGRWIAYA